MELAQALERLWHRPDFRSNPAKALARRLFWRVRWAFNADPWTLHLSTGARILAPKGGSGALIYYLGHSEPDTARFLLDFLRPGMSFWDIGAHIGEYSVLAANRVGPTGRVEAFEPHPALFDLLHQTAQVNQLGNLHLHRLAISTEPGFEELVLEKEPSLSHLLPHDSRLPSRPIVVVPSTPLDDLYRTSGYAPDLIKVDVEGAGRCVLEGASTLLDLPAGQAPAWIMEYSPEKCERYGYSARSLLFELGSYGYSPYWLTPAGIAEISFAELPQDGCTPFFAVKRELSGK